MSLKRLSPSQDVELRRVLMVDGVILICQRMWNYLQRIFLNPVTAVTARYAQGHVDIVDMLVGAKCNLDAADKVGKIL